ncbi:hypothetical protein BJY52DRAFT_1224173 [Lactarius psammicola]|nr:hypothetical protein BJY52DRAFT_1224173 [Lactarius psammicola]
MNCNRAVNGAALAGFWRMVGSPTGHGRAVPRDLATIAVIHIRFLEINLKKYDRPGATAARRGMSLSGRWRTDDHAHDEALERLVVPRAATANPLREGPNSSDGVEMKPKLRANASTMPVGWVSPVSRTLVETVREASGKCVLLGAVVAAIGRRAGRRVCEDDVPRRRVTVTLGIPRTGPRECFEVIRSLGGHSGAAMMHMFNLGVRASEKIGQLVGQRTGALKPNLSFPAKKKTGRGRRNVLDEQVDEIAWLRRSGVSYPGETPIW